MFHWPVDRALKYGLGGLSILVAAILVLVLGFLALEAYPVLAQGGWSRFFQGLDWHPLEGHFGIAPMLLASLLVCLGALTLAAPLGIALALYTSFVNPHRSGRGLQAMLALMAGIPSVVYGLWGLTVLVPLIAAWRPPGASLLAAILILTLMILPTIALTSASALNAVPQSLLAGGAALGLSPRAIALGIALPSARAGIMSGTLLAATRALGETLAVLMVAGNVPQIPSSFFDPVRVLTANIALEMAYAGGTHRASLFASGLLLTLMVMALVLVTHHQIAQGGVLRHA